MRPFRVVEPMSLNHRVPGSRATPPSCTAVVHEISQRDKDAFIFGEGCAGLARRQLAGTILCRPVLGGLAPPICSDLIYDRHSHVELRAGWRRYGRAVSWKRSTPHHSRRIARWYRNLERQKSASSGDFVTSSKRKGFSVHAK